MQFLVYSDHNPLFLSGKSTTLSFKNLKKVILAHNQPHLSLQEPEIKKNLSSPPMSITSYEVIFESLGGNTFGDYSADKSTLVAV